MVKLRESKRQELKIFVEMELQPHAHAFINATDIITHQRNFAEPGIVYLSIVKDSELAGYFILAKAPGDEDIEFRRVLIDQNRRGIGQIAIARMEQYCRDNLNGKRIWLDVYEDNARGKHIYEKLGYQQFKRGMYNGRHILYYQKDLEASQSD